MRPVVLGIFVSFLAAAARDQKMTVYRLFSHRGRTPKAVSLMEMTDGSEGLGGRI